MVAVKDRGVDRTEELECKPAILPSKWAYTGRVTVKESNQWWLSDWVEFRCDNGEKRRITFALDSYYREAAWVASTAKTVK